MNILILENNLADAELMRHELRKAGIEFKVKVARNKEEFLEALDQFDPGLILSDYSLPGFNVMGALGLARERFPEIPVIVVSGDIGEETAIETLKAGATDYVLKQRLARLGPVVHRALEEAALSAEKKRVEAALRESDQRLHSLFENSLDAIFMTAPDGQVFDVNPAACAMFGRSKEEFIRIGRGAPAADPEALAGVLADLGRTGKVHRELAYLRKDGTTIQADMTSVTVRNAEGLRSFVILHDITEQKRAEEVLKRDKITLEKLVRDSSRQLLTAQAELELAKRITDIGTLATSVAHELRTPLAAISLAAANIGRKAANPLLDKNLSSIKIKVAESSKVIDNLLFYSHLKAPRYEKVRIADILREAVKAAACNRKKDTLITTNLDSFSAVIEADPLQLQEAFSNILDNACAALSAVAHGEIKVWAAEDAGAVTVLIENIGPAIERGLLGCIFEPFLTTKGKGLGLGLYVCRQIIKFHNGALTVKSEPGATAFSVTLPRSSYNA